jgi:soluble lytic murein transglycosylase-like protein
MFLQRWVIRLLPLEVFFIGGLVLGWMGMRVLNLPGVELPLPLEAVASLETAPSAPAASTNTLSPIFTPEVQRWSEQIIQWAAPFQLDPNLAATVMQIESCGWASAVSRSGAQGLFQVMPFHFAEDEAMQDPAINAQRGLAYLALGLSKAGGDTGLAFAGYNGGHGQIVRPSANWPKETQRYWYWATGIYADAVSGQTSSPRLEEWLRAGGASLCAKAARQP